MKINIKKLDKYVDDGLLVRQKHPVHSLWIYNYSRKCQWENGWDEVTLMCRGLIVDDKGKVWAKPFEKFFNIEQLESVGLTIPNEEFDVYDKQDGSLIILFHYKNEWIFASRGSFTSDYSKKGEEIFNKNYSTSLLYTTQTYCFELLWREHVIVITPEKDDLVMLGSFVTETGEELDIQIPYYLNNFNVVKKYDGITDYTKLTSIIDGTNKEGFVVRFKSGFRVKIKFQEYFRLHKIITGVSTINIWEALRDGVDMTEFCENVPDEFDAWVRKKVKLYKSKFDILWEISVIRYNTIYEKFNGDFSNKKLVAEEIKNGNPEYVGILFNMVNEKEFDHILWDKIRPVFEKPSY